MSFVRSYNDVGFPRFDPRRVLSVLLSAFAWMGVGLAIVGTFGVLSYQVTQRRREFAVRLAFGAAPSRLFALVAHGAGGLGGVGLTLGLGLTGITTPLVRPQVYGVDTIDGTIYATVTVLLGAVIAVAGWWPARRAMTTEPAVLLQEE